MSAPPGPELYEISKVTRHCRLDVALFAYLPGLATCASIAQQLHTIARWRDIKTDQYHYSVAHIREPELAVAGASTGLDLVLFYIRTPLRYPSPKSSSRLLIAM